MWKPKEIIINEKVKSDPVTQRILDLCPGVRTACVQGGSAREVVEASEQLRHSGKSMLNKILAGKSVLYIAPATQVVDVFTMPDDRLVCPHFHRLKLASNACPYQCDWCYLKLTYRAAFPFNTVRAQYGRIKNQLESVLQKSRSPIAFNSGELADSLALEHLTGAAEEFIPWFGRSNNGYLFMLTKSDRVDGLLDLPHNGRTLLTWSLNNDRISRKFEIGAPTFPHRLSAAARARQAGYRVRLRLDPIVPMDGWKEAYAQTIDDIFSHVQPERITLGTLRFEEGFYRMRNSIFTTGRDLPEVMEGMVPMLPPGQVAGRKRPSLGKYSFPENKRIEIFRHAIEEIGKHSDCTLALCKESASVWEAVGLTPSKCACVCQLD